MKIRLLNLELAADNTLEPFSVEVWVDFEHVGAELKLEPTNAVLINPSSARAAGRALIRVADLLEAEEKVERRRRKPWHVRLREWWAT